MGSSLIVLSVLAALVALSEILARRGPLRHLGSALLVILLAAAAVNLRVLPPAGTEGSDPVYAALLGPVAQGAIFLLLLQVRLADLRRAGPVMIGAFLVGSVGTLLGVLVAYVLTGTDAALALHGPGVAAMYVGTYVGGSINFNAMAIAHGVASADPVLYTSAAIVDNLMTTLWMAVTLVLPRVLSRPGPAADVEAIVLDDHAGRGERMDAADLAVLIALSSGSVWASDRIANGLSTLAGIDVPGVLVLTTLALVAAQLGPVRRLRGTAVVGWVAVQLFLAAIGALCDVGMLVDAGSIGLRLFTFVAIALGVHGLFLVVAARMRQWPPTVVAIASQANVGGGTSALALARSLGRSDLAVPALLVGALGTAIGNYLGLVASWIVRSAPLGG